jgi:hypothetical protein
MQPHDEECQMKSKKQMRIGVIVKIREHAYGIKPGKCKYGKYERLKPEIFTDFI